MSWKKSKVIGLSLLMFALVLVSNPIEAQKVRKDQSILTKVSEDMYLNHGDIDSINWKLNSSIIAFLIWVLNEIYKSYRGRDKKMDEALSNLVKAVERIEEHQKHLVTHIEVSEQIRKEIAYMKSMQG